MRTSWVETAVRVGLAFLTGGTSSIYQMLHFVKTGTGLPTGGSDLNYFVRKVAENTGASESEVKTAIEEVNAEERRKREERFAPERWVREGGKEEKKEEKKPEIKNWLKAAAVVGAGLI